MLSLTLRFEDLRARDGRTRNAKLRTKVAFASLLLGNEWFHGSYLSHGVRISVVKSARNLANTAKHMLKHKHA